MLDVECVMLRRKDDPVGEYRELILYQVEGRCHSVWEATGYLRRGDFPFVKRKQLAFGNEQDMRRVFAETRELLCGDGFSVCEPDSASQV